MNNRSLLPSNLHEPGVGDGQYNQHQQRLSITPYPPYTTNGVELPSSASTVGAGTQHDGSGFESSPVAAGSTPKPTYAKRGKITIVACVPCRRRKTKCDGHRPACSQCASRDNSCVYDMTDDQRKLTHLRENVEQLQDKSSSYEGLLHTIQNSNEEEAMEVYRRLRSGQDLHFVAEHVQASHVLSGVGAGPRKQRSGRGRDNALFEQGRQSGRHLDFERLVRAIALSDEAGADDIVKRLKQQHEISAILHAVELKALPLPRLVQKSMPSSLECNFSRGDHTFGMIKNVDSRSAFASYAGQTSEFNEYRQDTPWTYVTDDPELIAHLVELYFTWQHSFLQSFPEKLFKSDMAAHRTKYCSPTLVSIICACGAFLSPREAVVQANGGGKRLLDLFYEEAVEHMRRDETSSLTNTAALSLISYIEGTKGRLSELWMTGGRGSLMALDINLHLKKHRTLTTDGHDDEEELANESKARAHAFWGSFHADTTTAFTLGRLPHYNVHGMTVDLPLIDAQEDEDEWRPQGVSELDHSISPGARSSCFHYTARLCEIINTTLLMFFAPTVSLSGTLLVEHYEKYLAWQQSLPDILRNPEGASPHVISLHMYYHTAVLLLFRPFLKARIVNSPSILPRDVCRQSANSISSLFAHHISTFGQHGLWMFQLHCLLTACTIHIINIPTIAATTRLTAACDALQNLVGRNEWASSSLKILRGLVEKWNLILPQEAEEALFRDVGAQAQATSGLGSRHWHPQQQPQEAEMSGINPSPELEHNPPFAPYAYNNNNHSLPHHEQHSQHQQHTTKRPSSRPHSSSKPNLHSNSNSPHDATLPSPRIGAHKRQRTMASESSTAMDMSNAHATQQQPQQRDVKQHSQSVTSYLYSPLVSQPAPFLVPVRSQRGSHHHNSSSSSNNNNNNDNNNGDISSHSPHDDTNGISNGIFTHQAPRAKMTGGGPHENMHVAATADAEASELAAMDFREYPDRVEGLSFDDDWRDPFMGFLDVGGGSNAAG